VGGAGGETPRCPAVLVGVRLALRDNLAFYRTLGYEPIGEHCHDGYDRPTWVAMRKPLAHA
jgi:hypothetical protein